MTVMTQERDWPRLSTAIRARREELGLTQPELASAAGISVSTVQILESGRTRARIPTTMASIEEALQWTPGSAADVLGGGRPTPAPQTTTSHPAVEGMPLRVQHELRRGTLVDSQVIEGPAGSRFVVIWQSGDEEEADALSDEDVASWARVQRALHNLPRNDE